MKSIFEQMGGTYTQVGDYFLPDLVLSEEEHMPIGIWGQRHLWYIKQHKHVFYANLLTSCRLNGYLSDIDKRAEDMLSRLVKEVAEQHGITEQLKADDPITWVCKMNNIRNCAMEIVNKELIYN